MTGVTLECCTLQKAALFFYHIIPPVASRCGKCSLLSGCSISLVDDSGLESESHKDRDTHSQNKVCWCLLYHTEKSSCMWNEEPVGVVRGRIVNLHQETGYSGNSTVYIVYGAVKKYSTTILISSQFQIFKHNLTKWCNTNSTCGKKYFPHFVKVRESGLSCS